MNISTRGSSSDAGDDAPLETEALDETGIERPTTMTAARVAAVDRNR